VSITPVLCYVDDHSDHYHYRAFFTTAPLEKQWGDDWDDAPFEHNAETPYRDTRAGGAHDIYLIRLSADLVMPSHGVLNSEYSVEAINRGDVPWLQSSPGSRDELRIWAGTPITKFVRILDRLDSIEWMASRDPWKGGEAT
jgi:hypothetical protein